MIAFLAGPDAACVTGASWSPDAGMPPMGPPACSRLRDDGRRRP